MRASIWKIDLTIFWALFTNITILKSEIFVRSVFFGSPSKVCRSWKCTYHVDSHASLEVVDTAKNEIHSATTAALTATSGTIWTSRIV